MLRPLAAGTDVVFGSRMMTPDGARRGGMPLYKRIANRVLTILENAAHGIRLTVAHTGYRTYSARLLRTVPFLRNSGELYDLARDPGETTNVIDTHREVAAAFLLRIWRHQARSGGGGSPVQRDEAARTRLRSLGYLID